MIALIQRVQNASVTIDDVCTARIGPGMLALIGVEKSDTHESPPQMAERLLSYRIFEDSHGKMNLDITQSGGSLLLVPQFTLTADTRKGRRPGFSHAAEPDTAAALFDQLASYCVQKSLTVERGTFGANMQVALVNDGPVTFWMQTSPSKQ